jgi:hypothetical protein
LKILIKIRNLKMVISKKDLLFKRTSDGIEFWSKVDPSDHYKNETSVICRSQEGSLLGGTRGGE